MTKRKKINMSINLFYNMETLENEEFLEKWKKSNKSQKRVSIMDEAFEFASQKAFEDFGISQSSFELEISKLILTLRNVLRREKGKNS